MVGHLKTTTKPSRSDEVLNTEEQIKITNQIKAQFDALTPKRPIKPNRSEPETQQNLVDSTFPSHNIPELEKLQSLQSNSQTILSSKGLVDTQDEFVETKYYQELLSIDKQHHTVRGFTLFLYLYLCPLFSFFNIFLQFLVFSFFVVEMKIDRKWVYKSG